MENKKIEFGRDVRKKMQLGVNILSDAVGSTLGPAGRNVIIEKDYGNPVSTKDGVTVAREIKLKDRFQNLGAQIVKEAASQTNDIAGDGTTTSTIIAQAIISEGIKQIDNGANPVELKRGIDKATKVVVKELKKYSNDITDNKQILQVANISANNDEEIGTLISEAMVRVGRDGVITIEESKTAESYLDVVEGMQFNRGYLSPYFINNNDNMQVQLTDPFILFYDKRISDGKSLIKVMEMCIQLNKQLLIVAEDIDSSALSILLVNKLRGSIMCCAVKAPEFGERRNQILEDLAILTGGRVLSPDKGDKLDKITEADFGKCKKITIDNKNTTIIDGNGSIEKIQERSKEIKTLLDNSSSNYETEKLQERLGKLSGGIAVIHIGAQTEVELKEKKDRVDDALHATKAAIDEGVISGGGIVLYEIGNTLTALDINDIQNTDQRFGVEVVLKAIKQPFKKIIENAGLVPEAIHYKIKAEEESKNVINNEKIMLGFDVRNEQVVDMLKSGIIDPTKVTRVALEKASAVAGSFLTTECSIVNDPDENKNQMDGMGMNQMQYE